MMFALVPDWEELFIVDPVTGVVTEDEAAVAAFGGSVATFVQDQLSDNSLSGSQDFTGFSGRNKNNDPIETEFAGHPDWEWDETNHPPKDDLFNVYSYATVVDDELIIYAGLERITNEGASHIDFEYNQAGINLDEDPPCDDPGVDDPTPCKFIGDKEHNDLLVVMDFEKGGGVGLVEIRRWDDKGTADRKDDEYVLVTMLEGEGCNGTDTVCAFNNHQDIDGGPWLNRGKNGAETNTLEPNTFTEVGVNVTELFGVTPCFNSVNAKSRTSPAFNSELKDFALGDFNLCRAVVETEVHNSDHEDITFGSVPFSTAIHDWAKVTGSGLPPSILPAPTGDVLFELIGDGECVRGTDDTNVIADWTIPLTSIGNGMAVADMLDDLGVELDDLLPGDYGFQVTYDGDTNYRNVTQEECEPFTIDKIDTTTATEIHANNDHDTDVQDTTLKVGNYVHDYVTVTPDLAGDLPAPTGELTVTRYRTNNCSGDVDAATEITLTAPDNGEVDDVLEILVDSIPDTVAHVSYNAVYAGDDIYNGSEHDCEVVAFEKYATRVVTEVRDSLDNDITGTAVFAGEVIHDWAEVSLAEAYTSAIPQPAFGGNFTFDIHPNQTCVGPLGSDPVGNTYPQTPAPGGDGSAVTDSFPMIEGALSWFVTYSGDGFYEGDNIPEPDCEPIQGLAIPTLIRTEIHEQGNHTDDIQIGVGAGSVPVGTYVHDLANVKADPSFEPFPITDDPEGLVEFKLFSDLGCNEGDLVAGWPKSFELGDDRSSLINEAETETNNVQLTSRGYISFTAEYLGQPGVYLAAGPAECEELEVTPLTPRIRTEIHAGDDHNTDIQIGVGSGEVQAGTAIHDKAIVSGDFGVPTGDVEFSLYNSLTCSGTLLAEYRLTLVDGMVETPEFTTFTGEFSYMAKYVGLAPDDNGDSVYTASADSHCERVVAVGNEGCTPGFWKNNFGRWVPTGLSPDQPLHTVFDMAPFPGLANDSLDDALNYGGGNSLEEKAEILLRAAVAALLNELHPDVAYSVGGVVGLVNDALASKDADTILDLATFLDDANNGVFDDNGGTNDCPLSADESNK